MRTRNVLFLLCWTVMGTGCTGFQFPMQTVMVEAGGPYWDGSAQSVSVEQVLHYFNQLRTLSGDERSAEVARVGRSYVEHKRTLDTIEYLMVLASSEPSLEERKKMQVLVADLLNESPPPFSVDVQRLLGLVANMASQLHCSSLGKSDAEAEAKKVELTQKLKNCRETSQTLAEQIQKLKDIERILTDRAQ